MTATSWARRRTSVRYSRQRGVPIEAAPHTRKGHMTVSACFPEDLRAAVDQFLSTDWTFEKAKTNAGLHSIHPYPARFAPHIPRNLLEIFAPLVGGPVLDPFCGCGTTLVECQARGIPSFGIDLNPIAALVSRVKTTPPEEELRPIAAQLAAAAQCTRAEAFPSIPRLAHWFSRGAIRALSGLTRVLDDVSETKTRDALRVALSRIIVRVSRQDSDTRYAAINRSICEADVYRLFVESAGTLDDVFRLERANMFRQWAPSQVLAKDVLTVQSRDLPHKFGLIITSPPYPNAYEYWLYHKYRMYWLGEDPIAVRNAEIGARPRYFRRNPETPEDFRRQMSQCFALFREVTTQYAIVCMVIGRSIVRGQYVDNANLLCSAAHDRGFQYIASNTRQIPPTRKAFNPMHGNINDETLLIFRRADP